MKVAVGLRRVAAGKRTSGRRAAQIADYARKDLIFMGFYLSKCVDGRYFNRAIPGYHNKIES